MKYRLLVLIYPRSDAPYLDLAPHWVVEDEYDYLPQNEVRNLFQYGYSPARGEVYAVLATNVMPVSE